MTSNQTTLPPLRCQVREELYERILDYTGVLNWAALCGSNGPNAPASAPKGVNPSPNARDFIQVRAAQQRVYMMYVCLDVCVNGSMGH